MRREESRRIIETRIGCMADAFLKEALVTLLPDIRRVQELEARVRELESQLYSARAELKRRPQTLVDRNDQTYVEAK